MGRYNSPRAALPDDGAAPDPPNYTIRSSASECARRNALMNVKISKLIIAGRPPKAPLSDIELQTAYWLVKTGEDWGSGSLGRPARRFPGMVVAEPGALENL